MDASKDLETGGSQKDLEFAGGSEQLKEERPYGDFPRRTALGTKGKAKEDEDFAARPPGQLSAVASVPHQALVNLEWPTIPTTR